ncbi:MAG: hypothetical protein RL531_49 [Actinomycetota bacterium]|jgi:phosphatidylglycerophosphatase C
MGDERRGVAAFDFDGTITRRDTLGPFLAHFVGRRAMLRAAVPHAHRLGGAAIGRADRDTAKERYFVSLLAGRPAAHLEAAGAEYGARVLDRAPFNAEVVQRMAWHAEVGHEIVVISASLAVYVRPVAAALGAHATFATEVEVVDGALTGRLVDGNVRAANKVARLTSWLRGADAEVWAYGDSAGDADLLAAADHPHLVRRGRIEPPH